MDLERKMAPIIGLIRYSQKITFGQSDKDVFEKTYFEYRYKIFTDVTLKSFQNQTDPNFILFVLHSETMPQQYKKLFEQLEAENRFLQNIFVADTAESFSEALNDSKKYVRFDNGVAVTFRVDNDDAVQNNFIETLKRFVDTRYIGFCVNFPTLQIVQRIAHDKFMLEERYYPSNSIGLANITSAENFTTVIQIAEHDQVNTNNPLVLLPKTSSSGLQTINGENAVNDINPHRATIMDSKSMYVYLKSKLFSEMNLDCLQIMELKEESKFEKLQRWSNLMIPPIFAKLVEIRNR